MILTVVIGLVLLANSDVINVIDGSVYITEADIRCTKLVTNNLCQGSIQYRHAFEVSQTGTITDRTIVLDKKTGEIDGALLYRKKPIKAHLDIASTGDIMKITILDG